MPQSRTPSPARDTKNGSTSAASKSGKDQMAVKPEADTGKSPTTTSPTKTKFATPVATDSTNDNLVKMDTSSPTRKKKVIFTSSSDSESDEGSSKKQKQVSTDDNEKDDEESRTKKSKKKRSREDEDDEELNQDEREEDEEQGGDDDEQDDDEEDDDMDEDDEDDEEGSDEEGGPRKKRRKNKTGAARFLDIEADVDDEDEDDDEEDDYEKDYDLDEAEEARIAAEDINKIREVDRSRSLKEDIDVEDQDLYFRTKYGRRDRVTADFANVPQQVLLPSVSDPSLFLVKCRPGKERDLVMSLLRKSMDFAESKQPLQILSVFCRDSLKGYIYIEARHKSYVQQAIDRMLGVYVSKIALVPIKDMVSTLHVTPEVLDLKFGGWVRIRKGKYKGDLGQVLEMYDSGDMVEIKLVPRLDIATLNGYNKKTVEEDVDMDEAAGGDTVAAAADAKKRKKPKPRVRPAPKLFNVADFERHVVSRDGNNFTINNDRFDDRGYLIKEFRISDLDHYNINPSLDEIMAFDPTLKSSDIVAQEVANAATGGNDTSPNAKGDAASIAAAQSKFHVGEAVDVIEGELNGSRGAISQILHGGRTVRVTLDSGIEVELAVRSLRKRFLEGEHVKVLAGVHKNESGLVVKILDNVVTLISDLNMKEIEVFSKDIVKASDTAAAEVSTTGLSYDIRDLVQIDFQTVGVVTNIDRSVYHVLDQFGTIRKLTAREIKSKRDTKRALATDVDGNTITAGDVVEVIDSPLRTKGMILHVYRSFLFLYSRDYLDNNGMFMGKTRGVRLVNTKGGRAIQSNDFKQPLPQATSSYSRGFMAGRGAGGGGATGGANGGQANGRGAGGRDGGWYNAMVRIKAGPYKGYIGMVKEVMESACRVELQSQFRTVTVEKAKLNRVDDRGNSVESRSSSYASTSTSSYQQPAPSAWGSATPQYNMGGSTPAYNMGGRTPAYDMGGRTPAYDMGGRTPAYDMGGRTPAYDMGGRTPAYDMGGRTPARDDDDDYGSSYASRRANTGTGRRGDADPETPFGGSRDAPTPHFGAASSTHPHAATVGATGATPYAAPTPYGGPATPAFMAGPATPGPGTVSGATPYGAATPSAGAATPYGDVSGPEPTSSSRASAQTGFAPGKKWATTNTQIIVSSFNGASFRNGAYDNQPGMIISVKDGGNSCEVRLFANNTTFNIPSSHLVPRPPEKKSRCIVLDGNLKGQLGNLVSIESDKGIVKLDEAVGSLAYTVLPLKDLARYGAEE